MHPLDRRTFLHKSTAAAAAAAGQLALARADTTAANDRIALGFIGVGGRGMSLLGGFAQRPDCELVAVCDPNRQRLDQAAARALELRGRKPQAYEDLRKLLDNPSIDAVVIATTDHWHAPATVWACQAGKHVYVEKPISNNPWEGRQAVEAARRRDRVVQAGTQNRSAPYNLSAQRYIHSGKLGKIHLCRVYNQKAYGSFLMSDPGQPPSYLNWDLWNGPCPDTKYHQTRFHHWHDFWRYGGGDVTNDGVHQLDLACMVLGITRLPRSVYTCGLAREGCAAETPDTVVTTMQFDELVMTFHQTLYTPYMLKTDGFVRENDMFPYWPQNATRIEVLGSEGVMVLGRHGGGWQVFGRPKDRQPVVVAQQ